MEERLRIKLKKYFNSLDGEEAHDVMKMVLDDVEPVVIQYVLDKVNQNQSKAAKILGLNRGTLKKKIDLYKL
ncbi:MAG: helix-turn-helix domain-containing protein [Gammaproteobacteria bacterium]|jgi:Fis family transcriptional regulator